jgi:hypothetical protein
VLSWAFTLRRREPTTSWELKNNQPDPPLKKQSYRSALLEGRETAGQGCLRPTGYYTTRNLVGGKKRPERRTDNLAAIMSRMTENVRGSTSRNPKGLHGLYRNIFTFTDYEARR